jgi:hypothetical protein
MPRIHSQPANGALAVLDAALGRRVMDAFNPVLRCSRDPTARVANPQVMYLDPLR